MRKILIITVILMGILAAVFFKDITGYFKNKPTEQEATDSAPPAITDGVSALLEVQQNEDENGEPIPLSKDDIRRAQATLLERIDSYSNMNAEINIKGDNQLEIKIPKVNIEQGKEILTRLTTSGKLTIHAAHPLHNQSNSEAHTLAKKVIEREEIVPTYKAYPQNKQDENGVYLRDAQGNFIVDQYWLVKRRVGVNGADIELAQASTTQPGTTEITLTVKGAEDMFKFTTDMKQGEFIITIIDGKVITAASLNAPSLGKRFVITGQATKEESRLLATALNTPLENDIEVLQIRRIVDSKIVEEK